MSWVTKGKCCEITGYTPGMIKARIQRGKWRQGIEWAYVDDLQMVDLDAIEARTVELAEAQRTDQPARRKATGQVVKLT